MFHRESCKKCQSKNTFYPVKKLKICDKQHYFGFSFFGGVRFYTFREMSVSLGIKKKANIWKCKACNSLLIKCPYCNNEMDIHMAKAEFCDFCKKSFYLCT